MNARFPIPQSRWAALTLLTLALVCAPAMAQQKVLRLVVTGSVPEAPSDAMDLAVLFGGEQLRTLHEWVSTIREAAEDDEIDGLALIIESPQASFAQLEELRRAIVDFKATGKPVHAYLDYAGNGSYLLATAADHIMMAENSSLDIMGLHIEQGFYKGLLDKIGVKAQMMHCGAYKGAAEPFMRTEPSDESREMTNWLLDGLFERYLDMIAEGRGISREEAEAAVDAAPLLLPDARERGLIDSIGSFNAFREMIHREYGQDVEITKSLDSDGLDVDMENPFAVFNFFKEMMESGPKRSEPAIALIYVDGGIMVGKSESSPFGGASAGSTTVRAALQEAYEDDNIKAVVLRVDSPGGSALASDIIWKAVRRVAERKPVIASMGGMAASGGYYVSVGADTIFAEETTLTGSIGVVGGKLVWQDLMEDHLGITTTEYKRGANADLMTMNRPFTPEEEQRLQQLLDDIYVQFKDRVTTSRGDRLSGELDEMAGGRVYTGTQALALGLVDELGGLTDAIALASERAGLTDPDVVVLPEAPDLAETLRMLMGEETGDEYEISAGSVLAHSPLMRSVLPLVGELAPRRLRTVALDLFNLSIIHREHVGCFVPATLPMP